jgi:hypothetical protein
VIRLNEDEFFKLKRGDFIIGNKSNRHFYTGVKTIICVDKININGRKTITGRIVNPEVNKNCVIDNIRPNSSFSYLGHEYFDKIELSPNIKNEYWLKLFIDEL